MAPLASILLLAGSIAFAGVALSTFTGTGPGALAQVATLGTPPPDADPDASATPEPELDAEESLLAYASCMRDYGIETDDPQFDINGDLISKPDFKAAMKKGQGGEAFTSAQEACGHLLMAVKPVLDLALQAEQTDKALAFAACMREQGLDWPDPAPDGTKFAGSAGEIDKQSPEFAAAFETCADELALGGEEGANDSGE